MEGCSAGNMGRGITVMCGVCKKELFDIPTTVE